jgi:uncharacterized protein HemX
LSHSVRPRSTLGKVIQMNSHRHSCTQSPHITYLTARIPPASIIRIQSDYSSMLRTVILIRTALSLGNAILSTGAVQTCLTRSSNHSHQNQPSALSISNQQSAISNRHQQSASAISNRLSESANSCQASAISIACEIHSTSAPTELISCAGHCA